MSTPTTTPDASTPTKAAPARKAAAPATSKATTKPASTRKPSAKAAPVPTAKADAKRELATLLIAAYAEAFAALPKDHPIFKVIPRADAAQDAANWVHHLPVIRERWNTRLLPKPVRSNW